MSEWNWDGLGECAYEAYRKTMTAGDYYPHWNSLDQESRKAWIAAAQEVCQTYVAAALA